MGVTRIRMDADLEVFFRMFVDFIILHGFPPGEQDFNHYYRLSSVKTRLEQMEARGWLTRVARIRGYRISAIERVPEPLRNDVIAWVRNEDGSRPSTEVMMSTVDKSRWSGWPEGVPSREDYIKDLDTYGILPHAIQRRDAIVNRYEVVKRQMQVNLGGLD